MQQFNCANKRAYLCERSLEKHAGPSESLGKKTDTREKREKGEGQFGLLSSVFIGLRTGRPTKIEAIYFERTQKKLHQICYK